MRQVQPEVEQRRHPQAAAPQPGQPVDQPGEAAEQHQQRAAGEVRQAEQRRGQRQGGPGAQPLAQALLQVAAEQRFLGKGNEEQVGQDELPEPGRRVEFRPQQAEFLNRLGAKQILDRATVADGVDKPLLKEQWAGAVDTVGGDILFNVVKSLQYGGSVACCGLTAGAGFKASVLPFILRGVNLLGVDSVELPLVVKASMWDKLSLQWKLDNLEEVAREIALEELPGAINQILAGKLVGRVLVNLG